MARDPNTVQRLRELADEQDDLHSTISELVSRLRAAGTTWREIGEVFGLTPQGAYYRFGEVDR